MNPLPPTTEVSARVQQLILLQGGRYRSRVDEATWSQQPVWMELPAAGEFAADPQRRLPPGEILVLPWDQPDPALLELWLANWLRRFGHLPATVVMITAIGHVSPGWLQSLGARFQVRFAAVAVAAGEVVGPDALALPLALVLDDDAAEMLQEVNPLEHIRGVPADPRDPAVFAERLRRAAPRTWLSRAVLMTNIGVFVLMQIADGMPLFSRFSYDTVMQFGANTSGRTVGAGETWRLLTATFLHADLMHLAMNMWALHVLGGVTERLFGVRSFAVIYLASALGGSVASLGFTLAENPNLPTVGASGAIFGLMGALLGFALSRRGSVPPQLYRSLTRDSLFFIGLNVLIGFSISFIDNAAHLGGLAAGLVGGLLLSRDLPPAPQPTLARRGGAIAVLAGLIGAAWKVLV